MNEGDDIVAVLLGRRLLGAYEVVVRVPGHTLVPSDTIVLLTDIGYLQLFTGLEPHAKRAVSLRGVDEVSLVGDYEDRLSITMREITNVRFPMMIAALYSVYETVGASSDKYLVGFLVEDDARRLSIGLRMHLDDVSIDEADAFWTYLRAITPGASRIIIERHPLSRSS